MSVWFSSRERERESVRERMRKWWRGRKKEQGSKPRCKVTGTEEKKMSYLERRRQCDSLKREIDREKHCVDKKTLKGTIQRWTEKEDYVIIWKEIVPLWADRWLAEWGRDEKGWRKQCGDHVPVLLSLMINNMQCCSIGSDPGEKQHTAALSEPVRTRFLLTNFIRECLSLCRCVCLQVYLLADS